MASNTSLIKSKLRASVAESHYDEIVHRHARYYYFIGKTTEWADEENPPKPDDNFSTELQSRLDLVAVKEITPTDCALVIPRYNWVSGSVYDSYDDLYGKSIIGIDLVSGGVNYATPPNIYIGDEGSVTWQANTSVSTGDMIKVSGVTPTYYAVTNGGTTGAIAPVHTSGTQLNGTATLLHINVSNGGGSGATAQVTQVSQGVVTAIKLTNGGTNYTNQPTVTIIGGNGSGATCNAVLVKAFSGAQRLEDSIYYVITDDFNVYKCLDNNRNAVSTVKPTGTSPYTFTTSDGYVWKFLYTVPIALRNKFVTIDYIPVAGAFNQQFYSSGNINHVDVLAAGSGYTYGSIAVEGDGYLESNPYYITGYTITTGGTGYTSATIAIEPPFSSSAWAASSQVFLGSRLSTTDNNIYEVIVAGTTGSTKPTHITGNVVNGTTVLKYIGTTATATATLSSGAITAIVLNRSLRDITITNHGSNYTSAPNVVFTNAVGDTTGSGAAATATIQNGKISKITITNPGSGYTAPPVITFTNGGGSGAAATALMKAGAGYQKSNPSVTINGNGTNAAISLTTVKSEAKLVPLFQSGQLKSIEVVDGGIGYTTAELTLTGDGTGASAAADLAIGDITSLQANVELLTVDGTITNIPVISGGYGYSTASVVIDGDGTGAAATATIQNGRVIKINMTNYGSGYRWARVTITGNGVGASARAIIGPYGGHGKYVESELCSRNIMFFNTVTDDLIAQFTLSNEFRQTGILKNIRSYGSTELYQGNKGCTCWRINATVNPSTFPLNTIVTTENGTKRFRIVENSGTKVLLQSIDNYVPTAGQIFTFGANTFSASSVTPPMVDKYSGDYIFVDNKEAFTPTDNQSVVLKTIVKF